MTVGRARKTIKAGRYELFFELAQGYLGSLWVARVTTGEGTGLCALVRRVPLDGVDEQSLTRVRQAAAFGAQVSHPGIVRIVETTFGGGALWVASDYVDGVPLRTLHSLASARRKHMPVGVALRIAADVLAALQALHRTWPRLQERGLSPFGGISPDSLLTCADGRTRLLDPVLAGVAATSEPFASHPERISYAAPEQIETGVSVDGRTDLFTVGVLLWELLSNRRLFIGSDQAVAQKVLAAKIPRLDEVKRRGDFDILPSVVNLVTRALERNAASRFQSAAEMLESLQQAGERIAEENEVAEFVQAVNEGGLARVREAIADFGAQAVPPLSSRIQVESPDARRDAPGGRGPQPERGGPSLKSTMRMGTPPALPAEPPSPAPRVEIEPPTAPLNPKPAPLRARQPTMMGIQPAFFGQGAPPASVNPGQDLRKSSFPKLGLPMPGGAHIRRVVQREERVAAQPIRPAELPNAPTAEALRAALTNESVDDLIAPPLTPPAGAGAAVAPGHRGGGDISSVQDEVTASYDMKDLVAVAVHSTPPAAPTAVSEPQPESVGQPARSAATANESVAQSAGSPAAAHESPLRATAQSAGTTDSAPEQPSASAAAAVYPSRIPPPLIHDPRANVRASVSPPRSATRSVLWGTTIVAVTVAGGVALAMWVMRSRSLEPEVLASPTPEPPVPTASSIPTLASASTTESAADLPASTTASGESADAAATAVSAEAETPPESSAQEPQVSAAPVKAAPTARRTAPARVYRAPARRRAAKRVETDKKYVPDDL